jgi:hypothetical protein
MCNVWTAACGLFLALISIRVFFENSHKSTDSKNQVSGMLSGVQLIVSRTVFGFCSCAVEVFVLLGYGALSLGDWCPIFSDSMMVFIFKAQRSSSSLGFFTFENETTVLVNSY